MRKFLLLLALLVAGICQQAAAQKEVPFSVFRAERPVPPLSARPVTDADARMFDRLPLDDSPGQSPKKLIFLGGGCGYPPIGGAQHIINDYSGSIGRFSIGTGAYTTIYAGQPAWPRVSVALENSAVGGFTDTNAPHGAHLIDVATGATTDLPIGDGWRSIAIDPWGHHAALSKVDIVNKLWLYDITDPSGPVLLKEFDVTLPDGIQSGAIDHIEFSPTGQNVIFQASRNGVSNIYLMNVWSNGAKSIGTGGVGNLLNLNGTAYGYLNPTFSKTVPGLIAYDELGTNISSTYVRDIFSPAPASLIQSLQFILCSNPIYGCPSFSPDGTAIACLHYLDDCNGPGYLNFCDPKLGIYGLSSSLNTTSCWMPSGGTVLGYFPNWYATGGRNWQKPVAEVDPADKQLIQPGDSVFFAPLPPTGSDCPISWKWKFPGGTPSESAFTTPGWVRYDKAGTYDVTLLVSNPGGVDSVLKKGHVVVGSQPPPPPAADFELLVGSAHGPAGSEALVPIIKKSGCDDLMALLGTASVASPGVAQIVDWKAGKLPALDLYNGTFLFSTATPTHAVNGDTLFFLKIKLTGAPGDSSLVSIGNVVATCADLLDHDGTAMSGLVKIDHFVKLNVVVKTASTGEPLANALVRLDCYGPNGDPLPTLLVKTDAGGKALFDNLPIGSGVVASASKDTLPGNGVSPADLVRIKQWLVGNTTNVSAWWQVVAANTDCSLKTDPNDAFQEKALILGSIKAFPGCPSWRLFSAGQNFPAPSPYTGFNLFSPPLLESFTLTNLTADHDLEFVAVKTGDLDGNAKPLFLSGGPASDGPQGLPLAASFLEKDGKAVLELRAAAPADLASLLLNLKYDESNLAFEAADGLDGWDFNAAEPGKIRLLWASPDGGGIKIAATQLVLKLVFSKKTAAALVTPNWFSLAEGSEAVTGQLETLGLSLKTEQASAATEAENLGLRCSVWPNPAGEAATVRIDLPEAADVVVSVFDAAGCLVDRRAGRFEAGGNSVSFPVKDWRPGLFAVVVNAGGRVSTKKLIVKP